MTNIEKAKVGGCVRDRIMGRASKDVDFVVVAPSFEAMRADIVASGATIFVENPEFATIRARVGRDVFDFVWARVDGPYSDGRRPDWTKPGTLMDDLSRRDFTMNAIAEFEDGTIFDPFDGVTDIQLGVIRTVGDAFDRFMEDGLRILRAIRFAIVFGFDIEEETVVAMRACKSRLFDVSIERVREEMEKAFAADSVRTFRMLEEFGLSEHVFTRGLRLSATTKG